MTMHAFRRISVPIRTEPPDADPSKYPAQDEIRTVLDDLHKQVLRELMSLDEAELDLPVLQPHPIAKTKLSALLWCAITRCCTLGRSACYAPVTLGIRRCGDVHNCFCSVGCHRNQTDGKSKEPKQRFARMAAVGRLGQPRRSRQRGDASHKRARPPDHRGRRFGPTAGPSD